MGEQWAGGREGGRRRSVGRWGKEGQGGGGERDRDRQSANAAARLLLSLLWPASAVVLLL